MIEYVITDNKMLRQSRTMQRYEKRRPADEAILLFEMRRRLAVIPAGAVPTSL